MPNWCLNNLTITGPEADVQAFKTKVAGHSPWQEPEGKPDALNFHSLVPVPEELLKSGSESAWSPPIEFLQRVSVQWSALVFVLAYEEPGMAFKGLAKFQGEIHEDHCIKGYTEGPDGTPYQNTPKEDRVTGLLPQLLNPIDQQEVKRLLKDPAWALQEKFDGRRVLVRKNQAEIHGINRKGLLIGLPSPIVVGDHKITSDFILDGECVGDVLYAFDLLEWDGEDLRTKPYQRRFVKLSSLLNRPDITHIEFAEIATDPANKERMFRHLQSEKKEGVVFQRLDAPYTPGRPNSGGNQLKHKFYATCSAVVAKTNDKRSVELRLLNGKGWIPCGNVTIPPNFKVPAVGEVVECRYLYAFRESNALYQPVYLGPRQDIEQHECVLSQLKYKGTGEEDLC